MASPKSSTDTVSSSSKNHLLTLRASDGAIFHVEEKALMQCTTIKNLVEDGCSDTMIPLTEIDGNTLSKIVERLKKHASVGQNSDDRAPTEELESWDAAFMKTLDQESLEQVLSAANFLDCARLLDLVSTKMVHDIEGMTFERRRFNIEGNFTAEELEAILQEDAWAHEI